MFLGRVLVKIAVNISNFCAAISVKGDFFCLEHQGVDESDEAGAISSGGRVTLGSRLLPSYTHFVEQTKKNPLKPLKLDKFGDIWQCMCTIQKGGN